MHMRTLTTCSADRRSWWLSLFVISFVAAIFLLLNQSVIAQEAVHTPLFQRGARRSPEFQVPPRMRPRVQFWIDVFARYGKHHAVIHHRMYPHIIFDVLDFYDKADSWSEAKIELHRKSALNTRLAQIKSALQGLGSGRSPKSSLEVRIADLMRDVPGGAKKYRDVIKNDWLRSQRGIRERYREAVERSGRYMHILEHTFVREFGLPVELTRLPFVESSFDYKAYSSVGAAGIWQFMPATGRAFNLQVGRLVDERRDVTAATNAAARYLRDAYKRLGTWPLALTSYNHGVAGVYRKVSAAGTKDIVALIERVDGQQFGFASQNFYPEFLAALEIYDNYERYFPGLRREAPKHIVRKKMTRPISVGQLSRQLGIPVAALQEVNYALHSDIWKGRYHIPANYTLNVPTHYKQTLAALPLPESEPESRALDSTSLPHSGSGQKTHLVRSGETLLKIARRYGVTVSDIRADNNLSSDLVRVGQRLAVSGGPARAESAANKQDQVSLSPRNVGSHSYTVRSGDSLFQIARSHRTTVENLRRANGLRGNTIRVGQVLKLPPGASGVNHSRADSSSTDGGGTQKPQLMSYKVRQGDTLWAIARRFGVSPNAISERNGLRSPTLKIGQKLTIPQ